MSNTYDFYSSPNQYMTNSYNYTEQIGDTQIRRGRNHPVAVGQGGGGYNMNHIVDKINYPYRYSDTGMSQAINSNRNIFNEMNERTEIQKQQTNINKVNENKNFYNFQNQDYSMMNGLSHHQKSHNYSSSPRRVNYNSRAHEFNRDSQNEQQRTTSLVNMKNVSANDEQYKISNTSNPQTKPQSEQRGPNIENKELALGRLSSFEQQAPHPENNTIFEKNEQAENVSPQIPNLSPNSNLNVSNVEKASSGKSESKNSQDTVNCTDNDTKNHQNGETKEKSSNTGHKTNPGTQNKQSVSQKGGKSGKSNVNSGSMSNNSGHNIANKNEVFLGGLPLNISTGEYFLYSRSYFFKSLTFPKMK